MNITKYTQSCLKIERDGRALLVDVGTLTTRDYSVKDFGDYDAVLFTHRHPDHFDLSVLGELAAGGATIYGNSDVAEHAGENKVEVIDPGEELVVAGFKIKAYDMPHCLMVDGSTGVPNTGYLINDTFLLPGDSVEDPGIKADIVALPIFGPDISLHDAHEFGKVLGAHQAILVHYDSAQMSPDIFMHLGGHWADHVTLHAPKNGETISL